MKYYFNEYELRIKSNNDYILNSIDYYFSIYKNLPHIDTKEVFKISLNKSNDILEEKEIKCNVSEKDLIVDFRRYKIYKISVNELLVKFYDSRIIFKIDIKHNIFLGFIYGPEFFGIDFIPNFIIIALIEILFKFKKKFFIHSSVLSKNNRGVMFIGGSGSGKSTSAFYFMSKGYKLITDDKSYSFIDKNCVRTGGLLQPIDIQKGKDDFLLNSNFYKINKFNMFDEGTRVVIKKYRTDQIENYCKIKAVVFPKISDFYNIKLLKKNRAMELLIKNSITPKVNINLKEHFKVLSNLTEQAKSYFINSTKNYEKTFEKVNGIIENDL